MIAFVMERNSGQHKKPQETTLYKRIEKTGSRSNLLENMKQNNSKKRRKLYTTNDTSLKSESIWLDRLSKKWHFLVLSGKWFHWFHIKICYFVILLFKSSSSSLLKICHFSFSLNVGNVSSSVHARSLCFARTFY